MKRTSGWPYILIWILTLIISSCAVSDSVSEEEPAYKDYLYVTCGFYDDIFAFNINNKTGKLYMVDGSPFLTGSEPRSVAIHLSGKYAYVINHLSLDISGFAINAETGALAELPGSPFPAGDEPVDIVIAPSGDFAYVTNCSSPGSISAFAINSDTGVLTEIAGSPFAARESPYKMAVDPSGRLAFVVNRGREYVSGFNIDGISGSLIEMDGSPFQAGFSPNDVAIDPTGKFVYVVCYDNRILAYAVDINNGILTEISGSPYTAYCDPESIAVDLAGKFLFIGNRGEPYFPDPVNVFTRNLVTGELTEIDGSPFKIYGQGGMSIVVDPSGKFLYTANYYSSSVTALSINVSTGALTVIAAYKLKLQPTAIAATRIGQRSGKRP